jgi:UDP-glucose 4-epimerase
MGLKVLVTGGAGFIGSHVVRHLIAMGHEVSVYDAFAVYAPPEAVTELPPLAFRLAGVLSDIRLIRGNLLDKDFLRRTLVRAKPDVVIHMAAMPLAVVALERTDEAFHSILTSTHNLLEILRDFEHPCRLVYVSSSMVYGDFCADQADEEHPRNPKDIYGALKLAGETIVSAYARNHGLDVVICRPSAVYGPLDLNRRVVQKFIANALRGRPIVLDGDGSMRLDFTYVEDCAQGTYLCATHPRASGRTYNVTRGEGRSLHDLAGIVRDHFPAVEIVHREVPAHVPRRGTLSIARARSELGFEPRICLEEGVRRYVEHLRAHAF